MSARRSNGVTNEIGDRGQEGGGRYERGEAAGRRRKTGGTKQNTGPLLVGNENVINSSPILNCLQDQTRV